MQMIDDRRARLRVFGVSFAWTRRYFCNRTSVDIQLFGWCSINFDNWLDKRPLKIRLNPNRAVSNKFRKWGFKSQLALES